MRKFRKIGAAAGVLSLAVVAAIPAHPAFADGIRDSQWHLKSLNISQVHKISKGAGVTVAVIDSGTYPHPDLRRNLLKGVDLTPKARGDGQGDQVGHGTSVSALIAAHGEGSSGVLGIAPLSKILPIKISNSRNDAPSEKMAEGVEWANENGAGVINISAGTSPAFDLRDAITSAIESGAVVVAGAGNTSSDLLLNYPAAFENVLAVGASGRDGKYDPLSIKDPKVDLCAPGIDIRSAKPKSGYQIASGTSDSTAIVSGAAALVRSKFPELSGKEVVHRLTATADDIGPPGRDDECGFGELNIVKALTADVPPLDGSSSSATPSASVTTEAPTTAPTPAPTSGDVDTSPDSDSASSNTSVIAGVVAIVLAIGALVGFLVVRRRRPS
ncbi:type VII secretion-associated serine protease mycosin [Micromonosporaceae bacterium Da 78-11]